MAEPRARPRANLVQRRSARRQPSFARPNGSRPEAGFAAATRGSWVRADRAWLSLCVANRFRFHSLGARKRRVAGASYSAGHHSGATAADRPHLRVDRRSQARDRAFVQLHLGTATPGGLWQIAARDFGASRARNALGKSRSREAA